MKFLLRAIPPVYLSILPAATIGEAGVALHTHRPRVVMFSRHTHKGGLAFENAEGMIEPSETKGEARRFVRMLREAHQRRDVSDVTDADAERTLECVFLNACTGLTLARTILSEPDFARLTIICWSTVTEDIAARTFAQVSQDSFEIHSRSNRDLVEVSVQISAEISVEISVQISVEFSAEFSVQISVEISAEISVQISVQFSAEISVQISVEFSAEISAEISADSSGL